MTHEQILEQSRKDLKAIYKQAKEKLAALEVGAPKELEVGKWYKTKSVNAIFYLTEIKEKYRENKGFGILNNSEWYDNREETTHMGKAYEVDNFTEATHEEVEKALIDEAKRKGHTYNEYNFNPEENELCGVNNGRLESVFCDGQWEQPVDKFAELKESHRSGAVIQMHSPMFNEWIDVDDKNLWLPLRQYRIKPEEKPKVGDVVKAWDNDEGKFVVGIIKEVDEYYRLEGGNYGYSYAKKLTPQQVQDYTTRILNV